MLRARLSNGSQIIGIDAENLRRLQAGEPIVADLSQTGGHDKVMIIFGETLAHVARELEEASGQKLPPAQPYIFRDGKEPKQ